MSAATDAAKIGRGGAVTAERVLDVAERLFGERGYSGTALRAIAAEVGIQNPSLYKHFASKAALYDAVIERAIDPILNEFWDTEDEIERVMLHLAKHPHVAQLILRELTSSPDTPTPGVARWLEALVHRTQEWLPSTPDLAPDAIPLRVLAFCHLVSGYFASAATYRTLTGRDPHSSRGLEEQTRIVTEVAVALFSKLGERGAKETP
jgi:AcrR family transcriptional regulator